MVLSLIELCCEKVGLYLKQFNASDFSMQNVSSWGLRCPFPKELEILPVQIKWLIVINWFKPTGFRFAYNIVSSEDLAKQNEKNQIENQL